MSNKVSEKATIDVALVTIEIPMMGETPAKELAMQTASKVAVTANMETADAVKLIIHGVLKAQKPAQHTITGNTIVLTDNVFIPELVQVLQGGEITYDTDGNVQSYTPPVAGVKHEPIKFTLNLYSAIYDASAKITGYEKVSYPNCEGVPVSMNSENNVFRVSEYTINSFPNSGEAPYTINYITDLPA